VHLLFATVKTLRREWGVGDKETRGQGDKEKEISYPLVPPSPCLLVSHSPLPTQSNPATTFSKIAQEFSPPSDYPSRVINRTYRTYRTYGGPMSPISPIGPVQEIFYRRTNHVAERRADSRSQRQARRSSCRNGGGDDHVHRRRRGDSPRAGQT